MPPRAASAWEIAIKTRSGRLHLADPLHTWMPEELERNGFLILNVTIDHAVAVATLPPPRRSDRLLIAQAQLEHPTVVTSDTVFDDYYRATLDARA